MEKTLTQIARMTDAEARAYLESLIWPNGPVCPHCGSSEVTRLHGTAHRVGLLKCRDCHEQFTVTVGSVMEDSHIPLQKWILGFHFICSSKKGMSAKQLQRELEFGSYETAWFMSHRIREAMNNGPLEKALKGTVEMDETYVGGKPRPGDGNEHKRGRGTSKTPVVAVVERSGESHSTPVSHVDTKTLKAIVSENVDTENSTLVTDELPLYNSVGREFAGGHRTVNHGDGQYVRNYKSLRVHTNTVESYFALLKRGHYGVYHKMSAKHLGRYCDEFSFRWDHRKVTDGQRTESAIEGAPGKRLMYKQLVGKE
jgi:transposase-like protein